MKTAYLALGYYLNECKVLNINTLYALKVATDIIIGSAKMFGLSPIIIESM